MVDARDRRSMFLQGLEAYRRGEAYEAHEYWEELWQDESDEARHRLLQALIQIASSVHKARHDVAPAGALRLLERAEERLSALPPVVMGVDVAALRGSLRPLARAIEEALSLDGHCRLDASVAPPLELVGEVGPWVAAASVPAVPEGARSAWFEQGLEAYRQGDYFDAHEAWEQLWRDERDEDHKQLLQGLIQVAAAMYKVQVQHRPRPASALVQRAMLRLGALPSDAFGLQMPRLLRELKRAQVALTVLADAEGAGATLSSEDVPTIARELA